jgi:hypothetical protein
MYPLGLKPARTPAKRFRLDGNPKEAEVLAVVKKTLQYDRRVAWVARMNTGKGYLLRCDYETVKRVIATGIISDGQVTWIEFGFEGCADLLGQLQDGRVLAVEAKRAKGKPDLAQEYFLAKVRGAGGVAGCVHSIDETLQLLEDNHD